MSGLHLYGQRRGRYLPAAVAACDSLLSLPTFITSNRALKISLAIFRVVEHFFVVLVTILLLASANTLTYQGGD